jgi:hypothetical protein
MTSRRPVAAASRAGARGRQHHSLAPAHLGEATAAATVAVVVGGIALTITALGIIALSLTIGGRYGGDPPPNVGSLAIGPVLLGIILLLLGIGLAAGGVAVLGGVRRSRLVTGVLSALGVVLAMIGQPPDPVIAIALTVAALVFGVAALLLLRPRR